MLNDATRDFIRQHADDDVRKLALQGARQPGVDLTMALQQIAGRQAARRKLPEWAATDGLLYPPHLNMEQCSSERTARYKRKLAERLTTGRERRVLADLTGGFGVDFYYMSQPFRERFYMERNEQLCAISSENFRLLKHSCHVACGEADDLLATLPHADIIFIDPARRNDNGARTYALADCTPNVMELLPRLTGKAAYVLLKLSPMLDWREAVRSLEGVAEVHIVSVDNECKELLLVIEAGGDREAAGDDQKAANDGREAANDYSLHCVNLRSDGTAQLFTIAAPPTGHAGTPQSASRLTSEVPAPPSGAALPTPTPIVPPSGAALPTPEDGYLYEPNASIMKAGCFTELGERFAISQVAENSHLYRADREIGDFPGRKFRILAISSLNKKEIKRTLTQQRHASDAPLERANISVRNFPMSADALRQRLHLKDGGDVYIFATTTADGQHRLFICRKIG